MRTRRCQENSSLTLLRGERINVFRIHPIGYVPLDRPGPVTGSAFFISRRVMNRAACYVDGFNLYHAIDNLDKPHLKWVDLWALAESLIYPNETLVSVNYFSAYATWLPANHARHRKYVKGLECHGVKAFMAHFKSKQRKCRGCQRTWIDHEEKETDVHIALRVLADAVDDVFDRAILISADSDLVPVLSLLKSRYPKKQILVATPPGRYSIGRDILQHAHSGIEITKGRIAKCLLPGEIYGADGKVIVTRPKNYDPPETAAI